MNGPLVVIGDTLLDVDIVGEAARLCPDAPVPVIGRAVERPRPGGAGLAALLAAADRPGRDVVLVTALADDDPGHRLRALLAPHVEVVALRLGGGTPCKMRVRAGRHPVARLDVGDGEAADGPVGPAVSDALAGAGTVLVSDYGRGMTRHRAVRSLLERLTGRTPVVWDPHPRGEPPVPGVRLVTPNEDEAALLAAALGGDTGGTGLSAAARRARFLAGTWNAAGVAVTLGASGALLHDGARTPFLVPAEPAEGDTCGAGDSFAAGAALALADGGALTDAVGEGVRDASRFVGAGGASALAARLAETGSPRTPAPREADAFEVAERTRRAGGTVVATGGCFDLLHAGHVSLLQQARRLGDCLVVCVNSDASVRRRKGPDRPVTTAGDRVRVLRALADVDAAVVFDDDTPAPLLERLRPDIWVKGADYAGTPLPEAGVVRSYGGEVVLLPLLEGRSTTRLLSSARSPSNGSPAGGAR
ncbi:D-glycero-beta-D-manno-heptose 1-phosphate adenylyltransferase [Actinomadura namibiensis]|uniref:D-glycero-beta-D-manno-heptose 1-phosphate adenylyltransferase n=1 Tax=Actinomadura namibiensis TaxID=182080 RepID=A0A7W3LR42_ACTNM|nr:D-glycero-beta-D-manno-heptose 1-phosphate adenylyltransferase [Actinomadura namibiensis]MBA8952730.1 rfaE bifunctional protein nucleotidyltransferase chain/domain [Actinomadura namibiensis]